MADHFSVKATLGKYGVRIVSVTEPIDANPEGKLMETILGSHFAALARFGHRPILTQPRALGKTSRTQTVGFV